MRRLSVLCLCLVVAALGGSGVATASSQTGTPVAAPVTAPLDLATMVLIPADVKRPHAAIVGGSRYFLDSYSRREAAALEAAGDQGGFIQWLGTSATASDYLVGSALDEFTDSTGASTGFSMLRQSGAAVSGIKTIGDESALYRGTTTDPNDPGRTGHMLTFYLRVGRLVGTIEIDDYTGAKPHAAEAVGLGQTMVARIRHVLAGDPTRPGLSNRAVRFKAPASTSFQDGYYRLAGTDRIGWQGDLPKGQPTFDETFPGATNVLLVGQNASTDVGAPSERVRLVEFPAAMAASAWLRRYVSIAERGSGGWQQVKPVAGAKAFGDESQTVTFQIPAASGAPGKTIYGAAVITRYGALAVSLRIQAFRPVPVKIVDDLMAAQAKCLKSTGNCPRVTPWHALLDLTVSPPSGWAPPASASASAAVADARRFAIA